MNLIESTSGPGDAFSLRYRPIRLILAAAAACLLFATPTHAQGSGVLTGLVLDTASKRPLPGVVVTATSPALQGNQTATTDKSGSYRVSNLPPGSYTLRFEGAGFKPSTIGGIVMRLTSTVRVNTDLLPEGIKAQ